MAAIVEHDGLGHVGVIAGSLALQSGAFGLVLHWLHQDLLGLRGDVGDDFAADVHRLETTMPATTASASPGSRPTRGAEHLRHRAVASPTVASSGARSPDREIRRADEGSVR